MPSLCFALLQPTDAEWFQQCNFCLYVYHCILIDLFNYWPIQTPPPQKKKKEKKLK